MRRFYNKWTAIRVLIAAAVVTPPAVVAEPWLLIDTQAETLTVMDDSGPIKAFGNIAVGVRGSGVKQKRGDEITPLGSFRIRWINPYSRFRLFFGLDYPNLEHATLALHDGRIDATTFERIRAALVNDEAPPQTTALGGQIGIHGVGRGDQFYHDNTDWTNGCVALSNEQIDELAELIGVGTAVEIR